MTGTIGSSTSPIRTQRQDPLAPAETPRALPAQQPAPVTVADVSRTPASPEVQAGARSNAVRGNATANALRAGLDNQLPAASVQRTASADAQTALNQRIADAAEAYRGTSTRNGPGGGRVACAFAVNNVLQNAIGRKIGENTDYVPSVEKALKQQATLIDPRDARPGDIVVAGDQSHIGIALGNDRVLSNSSSKKAFRWESGINFDGYYGNAASRVYRLNP